MPLHRQPIVGVGCVAGDVGPEPVRRDKGLGGLDAGEFDLDKAKRTVVKQGQFEQRAILEPALPAGLPDPAPLGGGPELVEPSGGELDLVFAPDHATLAFQGQEIPLCLLAQPHLDRVGRKRQLAIPDLLRHCAREIRQSRDEEFAFDFLGHERHIRPRISAQVAL